MASISELKRQEAERREALVAKAKLEEETKILEEEIKRHNAKLIAQAWNIFVNGKIYALMKILQQAQPGYQRNSLFDTVLHCNKGDFYTAYYHWENSYTHSPNVLKMDLQDKSLRIQKISLRSIWAASSIDRPLSNSDELIHHQNGAIIVWPRARYQVTLDESTGLSFLSNGPTQTLESEQLSADELVDAYIKAAAQQPIVENVSFKVVKTLGSFYSSGGPSMSSTSTRGDNSVYQVSPIEKEVWAWTSPF